jgi:hypothetical protein
VTLMTARSACIGLLPAGVSTGIGAQVQRPLAVVVAAGMLIGPVLPAGGRAGPAGDVLGRRSCPMAPMVCALRSRLSAVDW